MVVETRLTVTACRDRDDYVGQQKICPRRIYFTKCVQLLYIFAYKKNLIYIGT